VGRHVKAPDNRLRLMRGSALALVWLGGLAAGFFAILSIAARYGCGRSSHGLACRQSGSALGAALIAAVVAVVTAVTVVTHGRSTRGVWAAAAVGAVALIGCYLGARALIATA
jgi:FtsH-binding integral membrane protein